MGTDKALLAIQGQTLLDHALATARGATNQVAILAPRQKYADFAAPIVDDEFPGCGPLGGIHAALGASQTELNLLLSVDTPLVTPAFLLYLVERARAQPDALAIVPDAGGGIQGTCAVYRRPFRAVAEQQLNRGRYKLTETLALVRVEYVEENEIRAAGFDPAIFANLNTPEEFAHWTREQMRGK